jgi:hypothetical protein
MALNYVTVTGTFQDGSGNPLPLTGQAAYCLFTPSTAVYASGIPLITPAQPIQAPIVSGSLVGETGGACKLLATDNTGITFGGLTGFFYWTVGVYIAGQQVQQFSFFLPHLPSTVDLSALANTSTGGSVSYPITIALGGTGQTTAAAAIAALGGLPVAGGAMTGELSPAVVALVDGASIAVNAALGNDFRVTLGATGHTIANPANPVDGQQVIFQITQGAGGSMTVTWGAAYSFGSGSAPTLSTAAGATDMVGFKYNAAKVKWLYTGSVLGF